MIDRQPGLCLPLVYHLVQQSMLDFRPAVAGDVPTTNRQFHRTASPDVHRELTQPPLHPARQSDRNFPKRAPEMFLVEFAMARLQPVQQEHVTGTGPLATSLSCRRRRVLIHRESQKLPLGRSSQRPGNPGIQEPNDGPEDLIRSGRVAAMNPENSPLKTEHYCPVRVSDDSIHVSQPQFLEPVRKTIFEQE
jgi:hypothetical protein